MNQGDAAAGVEKLKPRVRDTGDRIYRVECKAKHLAGWTKVSRHPSSHKDLSPFLEGRMAQQLNIAKPWWRELVACNHDRDAYLAVTGHAACVAPPKPAAQPKKLPGRRRKRT